MKKALIIGGSGGLSSVVARYAMLQEYMVWALTRGNRPLPEGVIPIVADRNDLENAQKQLLAQDTRWDVIFDCICMNSEQAKWDIEFLSKVSKRIVVVSTDSVYDPNHKRTPQSEEGIFIEENGTNAEVSYGCNKRRMEVVFEEEMKKDNPKIDITIFRPGHIYGPGFLLGCFPENSRQANLPELILRGENVRLVGLGTYLIHPIYVDDLARVMVDCVSNCKSFGQIFCIGGPESVENREYYECIAKALGVPLNIDEIPLKGYVDAHPEYAGHLNHRIYDLKKLSDTGIKLPDTHIQEGINMHLKSLGYEIVIF